MLKVNKNWKDVKVKTCSIQEAKDVKIKYNSLLEHAIIEVEDSTTDEELLELQKSYPFSIVIRESDELKDWYYESLKEMKNGK